VRRSKPQVRECALHDQRLDLTLTPEAVGILGMPAQVSFALNLTPPQVDMLRLGLARVLASGRADEVPQRLSI
jgi:hypothetical protein